MYELCDAGCKRTVVKEEEMGEKKREEGDRMWEVKRGRELDRWKGRDEIIGARIHSLECCQLHCIGSLYMGFKLILIEVGKYDKINP